MKKVREQAAFLGTVLLAVLAVGCVCLRLPAGAGQNTAVAAARFILPYGNGAGFFSEDEEDGTETPGSSGQSQASGQETPSGSSAGSSGASSASSAQGIVTSQPSSALGSPSGGKVEEMCINTGGTQYQNFWVKNTNKNHTIDIGQELQKAPAVQIKKKAGPQVLIYHTHTTEAFNGVTRTTDKSLSVCAVGDEIAKQLESAGIGVVHDTTYHDYPAYNGSYDRSLATMRNDLKKYPSIQVTIDLHRDAMTRSDGTRLKPTAVVDGKKAAQVMIVAGCDDTGDLGFPNWEYNLRLAVRLQKSMADLFPDLGRPLDFCPRKYNENVTKGSILVEIGTDANTLDEALYGGELFGKALAQTLSALAG